MRRCCRIAIAIIGVLAPIAAKADVRFCNDYAQTIFIAIAYQQEGIAGWHAKGWLSVTTGQCSEYSHPPEHVTKMTYRAETDDYANNGQQVRETWGDKGARKFAVSDPGFDWDNAESLQGKPSGARLAGFTDTTFSGDDSVNDPAIVVRFNADASSDVSMGSN
jgi:Protein of unknown function (DUF1036)